MGGNVFGQDTFKVIFKSILFFLCSIVVYSIFQIIFVLSVSTGLGRDDIVGFSDNKYVIGRPPVSYNLYKKIVEKLY